MIYTSRLKGMLWVLLWILFEVQGKSNEESDPVVYMLGCLKNRYMTSLDYFSFNISILNYNNENASICISSHDTQSIDFTIKSKSTHTEWYTNSSKVEVWGSKLDWKGFKIKAERQLAVYGTSRVQYGLEGFLSIPVHQQGNIYYVVTGDSKGEFLVVGVYPNTCVQITLRSTKRKITYNNVTYRDGSIVTELLDEYSSMQLQSEGDFTGTEIRSSQVVSVFGGSRTMGNEGAKNYVVEQLPPSKYWGKQYVTVPPDGFQYTCKVMSSVPNTLVNYTCSTSTRESIVLSEAGSFLTMDFNTSNCMLISNKPILVTLILSTDKSFPAMVTLPALEEVTGEVMVYVSDHVSSAQLVLITNSNVTIDPESTSSLIQKQCPEHFEHCITIIKDVVPSQIYTISSGEEPIVISGYIHGTIDNRGKTKHATAYPILYHTVKHGQNLEDRTTNRAVLPDTCIQKGPNSTIASKEQASKNLPCRCCNFKNHSVEELERKIEILRVDLLVQVNRTSLFLRSLTSAPDQRMLSKIMGYTAGLILGCLGMAVVIVDTGNIKNMFKRIRRNLGHP